MLITLIFRNNKNKNVKRSNLKNEMSKFIPCYHVGLIKILILQNVLIT